MARKRSARAKTTVYRLDPADDLHTLIRDKYLDGDGFDAHEVTVSGLPGLLVSGEIDNPQARWATDLGELVDTPLSLGNRTAAAVLLLSLPDTTYALTYGMGHFLLNQEHVEPSFGLHYAARTLRHDELRSVTRQAVGQRAQTDQTSIPGGGDAQAFALAELNVVASRIVGRCPGPDAQAPDVTIRAADGLRVPLGRTPQLLATDLRNVTDVLRQPIAHPDLELLTRMTPLRHNHRDRAELDARLAAALRGDGNNPLGLGWPWELADEFAAVETAQLYFRKRLINTSTALAIGDITTVIRQWSNRDPLKVLADLKITLTADEDGEELVSPMLPARQWLAFETRIGDQLYFHHNGRWFSLASDYHQQVRREAERILTSPSTVTLATWKPGWDERKFNDNQGPDFLALDRKLIRTMMHPRGVEHCDLLGPKDEFIHVKHLRSSSDASHLFAQALVSTEQLLLDGEAREKLARKVDQASSGTRTAPERPATVVLAIYGRGHLTVDKLFTFSQVTLVRLAQHLERYGIVVDVVSIMDPPPTTSP
jgi:uncharacterized protein (TIGR04141 family)